MSAGQLFSRPAAEKQTQLRPGTVILVCVAACAWIGALPWLVSYAGAMDPNGGYLPFGPLMLLALLCWAVAPLAKRLFGKGRAVTRSALLFYCLTASLGGYATFFTVYQITPAISAARYFATPENRFAVEALPYLSDALTIKDFRIVSGFYEGSHSGRVPWGAWTGPLARWSALALAYLLTSACLVGIFRRRWIHQERLPFPLAEIPLFVAGRGSFGMAHDDARVRSRLLVIGIAIPVLFHSYNALRLYLPSIPPLSLGPYNYGTWMTMRPWDALYGLSWSQTYLQITLVGVSYLMPSSMALGIFGFYLLVLAMLVGSRYLGDPSLGPLRFSAWGSASSHQAGAYVGLLAFSVWAARAEIKQMVADLWRGTATGGPADAGDAAPPHPDRWMLVGFILGMVAIIWWCVAAGGAVLSSLGFVLAALSMTFGFALLASMAGLPAMQVDNLPQQFVTAFVPARALGMRNLLIGGVFDRLSWTKRHTNMPTTLQAFKIADSEGFSDRSFMSALLVVGVVVTIANNLSSLRLGYGHGIVPGAAARYAVETMGMPHYPIRWAQDALAAVDPARSFHWMVLGAISMWVVQGLYRQYAWWPVHPLGMLVPCGWQITATWFSVMIGWLIGRAITRYAGPRAYVSLRPLFLGLVLGDAAASALWMIICLATGIRGYGIPTVW